MRTTYNADGQLYLTERGTVNGLSDPDWAAFAALEKSEVFFDDHARPIKSVVYDGTSSTILILTQTRYHTRGTVRCRALRMNPASFADPESDACALGASGSYGEDRIVKYNIKPNYQLTKTIAAYGTSLEQDVVTYSYTANGRTATAEDEAGNLTTYEYDGFDRLVKVRYPSLTSPGTSSTTDYEEFTYDDAGAVLTARARDGRVITHTYDDLGRLTTRHVPGSAEGTPSKENYDYTYDNFGRVRTGYHHNLTLTYTYDALSRLVSKTDSIWSKTIAYDYDDAGRLTQMTYPDGWVLDYDYDAAGAPTAVRDGARTLVSVAYDDLGRRASLNYDNGASTSYGYDGVSRLTSLVHDLSGTAHDQTYGFAYNPAGPAREGAQTKSWPA